MSIFIKVVIGFNLDMSKEQFQDGPQYEIVADKVQEAIENGNYKAEVYGVPS